MAGVGGSFPQLRSQESTRTSAGIAIARKGATTGKLAFLFLDWIDLIFGAHRGREERLLERNLRVLLVILCVAHWKRSSPLVETY